MTTFWGDKRSYMDLRKLCHCHLWYSICNFACEVRSWLNITSTLSIDGDWRISRFVCSMAGRRMIAETSFGYGVVDCFLCIQEISL